MVEMMSSSGAPVLLPVALAPGVLLHLLVAEGLQKGPPALFF